MDSWSARWILCMTLLVWDEVIVLAFVKSLVAFTVLFPLSRGG